MKQKIKNVVLVLTVLMGIALGYVISIRTDVSPGIEDVLSSGILIIVELSLIATFTNEKKGSAFWSLFLGGAISLGSQWIKIQSFFEFKDGQYIVYAVWDLLIMLFVFLIIGYILGFCHGRGAMAFVTKSLLVLFCIYVSIKTGMQNKSALLITLSCTLITIILMGYVHICDKRKEAI
ncbi:MAG: hypothetical protein PHD56_08015 [Anaerostipes sp.]|nr:hypothetical protein [Anaerostipes sp.]